MHVTSYLRLPDCAVLVLDEDLDLLSPPLWEEVLTRAFGGDHHRLVVDVAKVRFRDSASVQALAEGRRRTVFRSL